MIPLQAWGCPDMSIGFMVARRDGNPYDCARPDGDGCGWAMMGQGRVGWRTISLCRYDRPGTGGRPTLDHGAAGGADRGR